MRQLFSGMAERIFMKLLPNDSGETEFPSPYANKARSRIIFWGLKTTQCALLHVGAGVAAWRMTQN